MKTKGRFRVICLITAFLILIQALHAQDIRIVGNDSKPPKYFLEDGLPQGILIEIMRYIDARMEEDFTIELYPWSRAYRIAEAGGAGIIGLSRTEERIEIFDYSDVMFFDELLLIVRRGEEFEYESVEDLEGLVLGARRGSSYGDDFERGRREIFILDEDNNAAERLSKLLAGRIDVALIGPGIAGFRAILRENPQLASREDEFAILPVPFSRDPNYLGFPKSMKMGDFIARFNEVLREGQDSGAIREIIENLFH